MPRACFSLFLLACLAIMPAAAVRAAEGGFLFVTFKGEATPQTEQIYFALSPDGRRWDALNHGNPVLVSTLGEKGVRDPYILRSPDGKKFFVIATDLSINRNHDWSRATHAGSRSIVVWESSDLVHWSEPRLVPVAAQDAGCTWAPEAVYDEATGDYFVFWASTNARDGFAKHRIWACRTRDFVTFGPPFVYIDRPTSVIDTDIVRDGGKYYRFSKDEQFKAITLESSVALLGSWQPVPGFSLAQLRGYEGPECFLLDPAVPGKPPAWCLILDQYSKGKGYQPFVSSDLGSGQFTAAPGFTFPFHFRHGAILPVAGPEYARLQSTYGTPP